ncbi:MAG TPA: carboxypeptidase regulatory-like domain-containing protein [Blastocatellia bacterium]|nr:carboxypeptidase regulatory-like domain-containing protein [Blastocatellia bacterium]
MFLILALSICPESWAQLGTSGISGLVSDPNGAAVAQAKVEVKNKATGQTRTTSTGQDGSYKLQNLAPAVYEIRVEAQSFATSVVDNVSVGVGEIPSVNVSLQISSTTAIVQIQASEALGVDTTTSQVASSISDRTLANLPLNGRNFLDLAFLLPGNRPAPNFDPTKTGSIEVSSAGQLGRGGNVAVDGADNNDDVVGGTLQNFPQDGIQEFQIITNRFSAEIGRSASSAVNILSKSGSNDFHGSAAVFIRHDAFSALPSTLSRESLELLGRPSFDREQYAGSLGGPIKRNRAWFFTAFENRQQDSVVLTGVRDFTTRSVLTSFSPAPLRDTLLTGRGDWQASNDDRMGVRYSLQRENDIDRGSLRLPIGTADNRQHSFNNYQSFVYNWTHTFSPRLLNDFVFHENNFINRIPTFVEGRNELRFPSVQDGGNFRIPQRTRQNRLQFRDNLSWIAGSHALKFGGEFQKLDADAIFDLFGSGTIFLAEDFAAQDRNGDGQVNDFDIPITMVIRSVAPNRPPTVLDLDNKFVASYIQDDWKVRPNFTLNLGLRYELDTNTKNLANFAELNPILRPFVIGQRKKDKNNFSPRIGFNWAPGKDGRTSIRGGYGIYYDRVVLEVPLLERLLDGRTLPLEVRNGSQLNAAGGFLPGTPTLQNPLAGALIPGAGAVGINIIDNQMDTPYVQQFSFGVQREIMRDLTISVDGLHSFGSSFIIGRSIGTVFNPVVAGNDSIVNIESSVKTWYDALLFNAQKRFSNRFSFNASYTLSKSSNYSNDDQIPFQVGPLDPNRLRLEKGPVPNDERHRFTFAGVFDAKWGLQISPIFTLASDVPFDIVLPNGASRIPVLQRNAGGRQFRTGSELNAFLNQYNAGLAPLDRLPLVRDDLRFGDSFQAFDLRLTKTFKLRERMSIQGIAEVFNLFNVTNIRGSGTLNYSGFQNTLVRDSNLPTEPGYLRSSSFGSPVQTAGGVFGTGGPRAFQFAVRFQF